MDIQLKRWLWFWSRVEKTASCWIWTGPASTGIRPNDGGYGRFCVNYRDTYAHRFAYESTKGKIPAGMEIDHLCRNRLCVNPSHLEVVTPKTNQHRGFSNSGINARKTHCMRGHGLSGENLGIHSTHGYRICRICDRARRKAWRERSVR